MIEDAIRVRAFELSLRPGAGDPEENWLEAEHELAVAHEYDTADRDLERVGIRLSRLPAEAGAVWRLALPRGETVDGWEPGNNGLAPPPEIARLLDRVAAGKALVPSPPASTDPGAVRLRELLERQRDELLAHDPGTRLGVDPENLHKYRVAARRARAFLRATRKHVDDSWRVALETRLRELGAATGPVRDLDVLLEHVRAEAATMEEHIDGLVELLERERMGARARLMGALDSDAYRSLMARLRLPPRLAEGVESIPLERLARKELRRLTDAVAMLGDAPPEDAIHALRIKLKRVRYATELAAVDEKKSQRRLIAAAKELQDLLGEHQDAIVAEQHLRATTVVDPATHAAFVAGRLAERQRLRRARVREALPAAWQRLRKAG